MIRRAALANSFSARLYLLIVLITGSVAAQSAPPRKGIPAIAKAANGAVVSIVMSDKNGNPIAQGSGFLVSKDGIIITNYHVIAEGSSALVKLPDGAFYVVDGVLAFLLIPTASVRLASMCCFQPYQRFPKPHVIISKSSKPPMHLISIATSMCALTMTATNPLLPLLLRRAMWLG
jgi:hypothetical protein